MATWHPSARPVSLELGDQSPKPTWLGLTMKRHENPTPDTAIVEYDLSALIVSARVE